MTPAQRLALSRQAIVDHIEGRGPKREERVKSDAPGQAARGEPPWWSDALRGWWQHHPAHIALEFARPMLSSYAKVSPWKMVGAALAAGVVAVVLRPWRLLTLSGLLFGVLRGSQLPRMLFSLLGAAQRRIR